MPWRTAQWTCLSCAAELEPVVTVAGRFLRCPSCGGAWVTEGVLSAMLREMTESAVHVQVAPREGDPPGRPCPECRQPMLAVAIGGPHRIDRCDSHGLWFDPVELEETLRSPGASSA